MPEPPQLTPFDVQEQRLYSKFPVDGRAPLHISKGEPSHPLKEANFSRLYPRPHSFSYYSDPVIIGDGWNKCEPIN